MDEKKELSCGLIMPISAIDNCPKEHWNDVKNIIIDTVRSVDKYSIKAQLVSDADDIGVIQKRIIQNVYNSDIVICDVSCKNPNVMFELGMRLAFDKPTIIIKDDHTSYTFDTGVIEHLEYPRDLRFNTIVEFKSKLKVKLISTYEESIKDPDASVFLKNFGTFKVASLDVKEVSVDKAILESIEELRGEIRRSRKQNSKNSNEYPYEAIVKAEKYLKDKAHGLDMYDKNEFIAVYDFYRELMEYINAPRYFSTEEQFREFYDYILRKLDISEDVPF
jgi:hypothetical protein